MTQSGDPKGRRLARSKANTLGQANRLAEVLLRILEQASFDTELCKALLQQITREEQASLLRAYGRVESRRRFQGQGPPPLREARIVNHLLLDECGVSSPEPKHQPQIFALGGVAFASDADLEDYTKKSDELKREFFGTAEITLHEPYMRRHHGPYYFEGDVAKQKRFDIALSELIEGSRFTVFGVGVRKAAFQEDFIGTNLDPYLPVDAYALAILMLMERYVDYLAHLPDKSVGRVTLESIGPKEDALHQLNFAQLLLGGSQWVPDSAFRNWLETGLRFVTKASPQPAELADMVSREVFEWVRDGCTTEHQRWPLFSKKIYSRGDGLMGKFGVKVFPDSDIREAVLAHRTANGAAGE